MPLSDASISLLRSRHCCAKETFLLESVCENASEKKCQVKGKFEGREGILQLGLSDRYKDNLEAPSLSLLFFSKDLGPTRTWTLGFFFSVSYYLPVGFKLM